jgi:hypothetical protein
LSVTAQSTWLVVSLNHVIDEWLRVAEHENSPREAWCEFLYTGH